MQPIQHDPDTVYLLSTILELDITAQCFTDKDVFQKLNEVLEPRGHRICYRTYQRYKKAAQMYGELDEEEQQSFDPIYRKLYNEMQRTALVQKEKLFTAFMNSTGRESINYRWLLERKYSDLNLRAQTQRFMNEIALEQKMLEEDIAYELQQKNQPAPPPPKPEEQTSYEEDAKAEALKAIPPHEQEAFSEYWDHIQHEWDHKNPITNSYQFTGDVYKKLVFHYQTEFALWEREKKWWLKKMAA